jgi:imidazoleglycerol-phosphate dehydratase / histidinol-phosphatase
VEKILFIDRDGTIIKEPEDKQIDSLEKIEFLDNAISSLKQLVNSHKLVMISNQDGLGTDSFPEADFAKPQEKILSILKAEQIHFDDILICPHFEKDNCSCRKPETKLILDYLYKNNIVLDKENSFVLGDRDSDRILAERLELEFITFDQADPKSWSNAISAIDRDRISEKTRKTNETDIWIKCNLDGAGNYQIETGLPFFNHMLEQLSKHGKIDLDIKATGDIEIDAHHLIEDTAILLGTVIKEALGNKRGIERYASILPMDEALATVSIDLSGRSYCKFSAKFDRKEIGLFPLEMVEHFFESFSKSLGATVHAKVRGENDHHKVEILFKSLAKSLKEAVKKSGTDLPSTKGKL